MRSQRHQILAYLLPLLLVRCSVVAPREVVMVHWPGNGSLVSIGSLSSVGIRTEFYGLSEKHLYYSDILVEAGHDSCQQASKVFLGLELQPFRIWPRSIPWFDRRGLPQTSRKSWRVLHDMIWPDDEPGNYPLPLRATIRLFRDGPGLEGTSRVQVSESVMLWKILDDRGGRGGGPVLDEERSERIVSDWLLEDQDIPGEMLAKTGYNARIRGLHADASYNFELRLDGELFWSEVLSGEDHPDGHVLVFVHLPLLSDGIHVARLDLRLQGGGLVASSNLTMSIGGDEDEGPESDEKWVLDEEWCSRTEHNNVTCSPSGYRLVGDHEMFGDVPDTSAICEDLSARGVQRIIFRGDSFARYVYIALVSILTGDYQSGALHHDGPPLEYRECREGEEMYSKRECRDHLSFEVTACHGRVNITFDAYIRCAHPPHCAGPRDLYVVSLGRHPIEGHGRDREKWEIPGAEFETPAGGPWEWEVTCGTMNWGGVQHKANFICRCKCSRDGSKLVAEYATANNEDDANFLFLSWHYELHDWVRELNSTQDEGPHWIFKQPSNGILDGEENIARLCPSLMVDSTQRYVDRFWQDRIMHLCSRPSVVDTWSYTKTLSQDLPEEAVKMTRDGFHWGRAVSVITAHKIIRRHLELLDQRSGQVPR